MMAITLYEAKKQGHLKTEKGLVHDLQHLDWATLRQIRKWRNGSEDRDNGWIERKLKKLAETVPPKIRRIWYAGRMVYSCMRINRKYKDRQPNNIYHGLGVTESMIDFWWADEGEKKHVLPSHFSGEQIRPDKIIFYASSQTFLDIEFCTEDNFERRLEYKIRRYEEFLVRHIDHTAVFICDTSAERLAAAIERYKPTGGGMYFVDLKTFTEVALGSHLTAPIYLWEDGQKYPLR